MTMRNDIFLEVYTKMMTGIIKEQQETEITEQGQTTGARHFYLKIFMQDPRSVEPDGDDDPSWSYDEDGYPDEFIGTKEDSPMTKQFEQFGGVALDGDTDSAERNGGPNMGDICYYYEFKDISLDKLFELANTEEDWSGIPFGEIWTNDDNGESYAWSSENQDPEFLVECLQKALECGHSFAIVDFKEL